jgi:capsular exopolysaccharide synthesis family protein
MDPKRTNHALALPPAASAEPPILPSGAGLYGMLAFAGDGGGPPGLTSAPTLSGLTQAVRRRWLLAIGTAALAALLAVAAVFICLPPRYIVEARFNVMAASDTRPFDPGQDVHAEFALFKEYEKALIHAPMVLAAALNEKVATGREVRDLPIVRAQGNDILDWMDKSLKADFKVAPEIMSAFLSGEDPEGLADLLNAIGSAFVKENDEKEKVRRKERVEQYRESLKRKEQELSGLRGKLIAKNVPEEIKDGNARKLKFEQAQDNLRLCRLQLQNSELHRLDNDHDLADWQARLKGIDKHPAPPDQVDEFLRSDSKSKLIQDAIDAVDAKILEIDRTGADKAVIGSLIAKEQATRATLQEKLEHRKKTCLPEVEARYRAKLKADLTDKIDTAERKRASYAVQITTLQKQVESHSGLVAALDPSVANDPPDVAHLKDEIRTLEKSCDHIRHTIDLLGAESAMSRVSFQVRASPPTDRDYTRQLKLAGAGGVSALMLALFGVALVEFRTRRISMSEEVSRGLGLQVVGSLPAVRAVRAARAAQTPAKQTAPAVDGIGQAQLQEAVDGVRTMLLHAARSEPLRVIMVTSATGGEGKTSVATQLAASLARAWRKTLLIDGDLRSPAAHRVFDLPRDPGLCEVLRNEVSVEDAIRPAPVSRLWVLPAGQWDAHAIQALAQDEVHALFEQLKGQYDFIIVDSSPVLPVADALLLAQHVDGVLFSILRDVSRVPEVFAAQQRLAPLGVRTLGAVAIGMTSELSKRAYQYAAS